MRALTKGMSDVEGVVLLGNRDDLSAVLTIRGDPSFSLLKRRDRVRNRRKELMKIFVEVPSHLHQASNEIMSILLCLVNVLLQSHSRVPTIVEVLLVYLATVVLVDVPTMEHQHCSIPFVLFEP